MLRYKGKIDKVSGKEITVKLDEEFDVLAAKRLANKNNIHVLVTVEDKKMITPEQQKMLYSLFREYARHTGYSEDWCKSYFKELYKVNFNIPGETKISLSHAKMTKAQATDFIEMLIKYLFEENVAFKAKEYFTLDGDITRTLFVWIKYRICFACGNVHGEVHHVDTVGMGNNRHKINHADRRYLCLCRKHHNEVHMIGLMNFLEKYKLVPIRLNEQHIKEFKIK